MRLAIVAETPSFAETFLPHIVNTFPDAELTSTLTCFPIFGWYVGNQRFELPRGLRWKDYPHVGTPVINPIGFKKACATFGFGTALSRRAEEVEAVDYLLAADCILVLMSPNEASAYLAAKFLVDHFESVPWTKAIFPWITDLSEASVAQSLRDASPLDIRKNLVCRGEIRRYFDYNYLANAIPILGAVAKRVGIEGGGPSKYGLQLLYHCRHFSSVSDGDLVSAMDQWRGTGKYSMGSGDFGSSRSRFAILQSLEADGYLERVGKHLRLSDRGERFLQLLHPRCEDSDLPFRIANWSVLPPDEGQKGIARYIRSFFGRQKTFMA